MKIWWVLLKSDDDLVFFCSNLMSFLQIWQRFDFFCLDLVSFAQIYQRFGKKYKSPPKGTFGDIFINFDRSDQWSNKFDPTWLVGFYGRWRVFSPKTRCHRVGCELGTNPTWTGSWTLLGIYMDMCVIIMFEFGEYCFIKSIKWKFKFWNFLSENLKSSIFDPSKLLLDWSK